MPWVWRQGLTPKHHEALYNKFFLCIFTPTSKWLPPYFNTSTCLDTPLHLSSNMTKFDYIVVFEEKKYIFYKQNTEVVDMEPKGRLRVKTVVWKRPQEAEIREEKSDTEWQLHCRRLWELFQTKLQRAIQGSALIFPFLTVKEKNLPSWTTVLISVELHRSKGWQILFWSFNVKFKAPIINQAWPPLSPREGAERRENDLIHGFDGWQSGASATMLLELHQFAQRGPEQKRRVMRPEK